MNERTRCHRAPAGAAFTVGADWVSDQVHARAEKRARNSCRCIPAHCLKSTYEITLRALTRQDVEAHNVGEDERTVRWLTGGYGTVESTTVHFDRLAGNARAGCGKRGFGVCLDGRLAGYVDCDPDVGDGLEPGDVNIGYAVHPWARGRGVAGEAVRLMCEYLREHRIGTRAAIRVDTGNHASVRVAEKSGFIYVHDFTSGTDVQPDGTPVTMRLYVRDV